jgi:hypothetical protein
MTACIDDLLVLDTTVSKTDRAEVPHPPRSMEQQHGSPGGARHSGFNADLPPAQR